MDLAAVPELTESTADKLREVGIRSAEALAVWDDIPRLAEAAGIDAEALASFREAAQHRVERALADAGVAGPEALATADLAAVSAQVGIEIPYLEYYQRRAREAVGKVVLADGAPVARVHVGEATHHAVQLVTATAADNEDEMLSRAGGDAVLLKPQAEVVPAIIGGVTHRALPLYKERRKEGGEVEEVRVRVAEIREVEKKPDAPKKSGGIGRLFSKREH